MRGALSGRNMLAHTRVDADRKRLIAAAADFDAIGDKTTTTFWEFDERGNKIAAVDDVEQSCRGGAG